MLDRQVDEIHQQIIAWTRSCPLSQKLQKVPGIGPLSATALVAAVADARSYKNGRQMAAWLGLVPRQHSSGGKAKLLGISKRGDTYLRTLLIHGARSVILAAKRRKLSTENSWLARLLYRRHPNIAAVALANKNARIVWALWLTGGTSMLTSHDTHRGVRGPEHPTELSGDPTTGCSGDHAVMAKQVRPWLGKPRHSQHLECV